MLGFYEVANLSYLPKNFLRTCIIVWGVLESSQIPEQPLFLNTQILYIFKIEIIKKVI